MNMLCVILAVLNVLLVIFLLQQQIRKPKTLGSIIITDEDSLYVELNDEKSMDEIHNSSMVLFSVHKNSQK